MSNAIAKPTTQPLDAALARQSVLSVMSSTAWDMLLRNDATDEEIRNALGTKALDAVKPALAGVEAQLAPANEIDISVAVGQFVGLVGSSWHDDAREEFINLVVAEFLELPGQLLMDALRDARRTLSEGRKLVPWVCEQIEARQARLVSQRQHLVRLNDIAFNGC